MSIQSFLSDPTWQKVHGSTVLATGGLCALVLKRFLVLRERKHDIYKPSVMAAELYGMNDEVDVHEQQQVSVTESSPGGPKPRYRSRWSVLATAVFIVSCIAVTISGYSLALRDYVILNSWNDGDARAYIGDYIGAVVYYKKALRFGPSLRHTHLLIGVALLQAGKGTSAIEELKLAANGKAEDPKAATDLGDALMILKRPTEAASAYKQAINMSPESPDYYLAFASALEKMGRVDDSYRAYETAIRQDPLNVRAHTKLGDMLSRTGHNDEGIAHCRKAVEMAPNDVIARNTLATALVRMGSYEEAIKEYEKSIDLDPRQPTPYYDMGMTLKRTQEFSRAIDAFKMSAALQPKNSVDLEAVKRAKRELDMSGH